MRCPHCEHRHDGSYECPNCHLIGDSDIVLEMHQVSYLLTEMRSWSAIPEWLLDPLIDRYQRRKEALERDLGLLVEPQLTLDDALALRQAITNYEVWHQWLTRWLRGRQMELTEGQTRPSDLQAQIQQWQAHLAEAPELPLETEEERRQRLLEAARFVLDKAEGWRTAGLLADTAVVELTAEITALEIQLGLRPAEPELPTEPPLAEPEITLLTPAEEAQARAQKTRAASATSPPKPKRRNPLTWDKVWETLLSERTLRVILFLAVVLLFSGAVSIVINEWQSFPRWAQVSFLAGFTAVFYGLGWFVRQRLKLEGSGLALTAVASLLIPLDFYTFYLSGGFPVDSGPAVWVLASSVCLMAYILTAFLIHAESFGYLVALAGGSLVLALANWAGLDSVWWQPLVVAYALLLVGLARIIPRLSGLALLTRPSWHVALAGTAVSLLINLMLLLLGLTSSQPALLAAAVSWWLACVLTVLAISRYPLQITVLGMAVSPFIAMSLTQAWLANLWGWPVAAYAVGWALLVPLYWVIWLNLNRGPEQEAHDAIKKELLPGLPSPLTDGARIILGAGLTTLVLSALWALSDMQVTMLVHLLLAVFFGYAAVSWRRPALLWPAGLLLMTSSGSFMSTLNQPLAMLGLPWAGLALVALGLAFWSPAKADDFRATLARMAIPLAGFAILPALLDTDHRLLLVTLTVWMGVNLVWAAMTHGRGWVLLPFGQGQTPKQRLGRIPWSQWLVVLPIVPYLYLWGDLFNLSAVSLAALFIGAGYALLAVGLRVQRITWQYRWPWLIIANLCQLLVILFLITIPNWTSEAWTPVVGWVALAGFFVGQAWQTNYRWSAVVGLLLLPLAWLRLVFYLGTINEAWLAYWSIGVALILLAYELAAVWLARQVDSRPWLGPLHLTTSIYTGLYLLAGSFTVLLLWIFNAPNFWPFFDTYTAVTFLILSAVTAVRSWQTARERWSFITLGWFLAGVGLLAIHYTTGTGISAFLAALLAAALFLSERGLHQAARQKLANKAWRKLWRLSRRMLKLGGWIVTAVALYLALWHNLFDLELTVGRQSWSIVTLALLGMLFLACDRLYQRPLFTLLASITAVPLWVLTIDQLFKPTASWLIVSLFILALLGLALVTAVFEQYQRQQKTPLTLGWRGRAVLAVAHSLVPFAVLATLAAAITANSAASGEVWLTTPLGLGLAMLFYIAATWQDHHFHLMDGLWRGRFLYPLWFIVPLFIFRLAIALSLDVTGWLFMGAGLLALLVGHWFYHQANSRAYVWPLMFLAYWLAFIGTNSVVNDQFLFIVFLLLDAGLCILSAVRLQKPVWLFPALVFLPWAVGLAMRDVGVPPHRFGWGWLILGAILLGLGWFLGRDRQQILGLDQKVTLRVRHSRPVLIGALIITGLGAVVSSFGYLEAAVGYLAAAVILAIMGRWLRLPAIWNVAVASLVVAYTAVALWQSPYTWLALTLWPLIIGLLVLGRYTDRWGEETKSAPGPESDWVTSIVARLLNWWGLVAYFCAFSAILISTAVGWQRGPDATLLLVSLLSIAVFVWAMYHFRARFFTLCATLWGQLAGYALISWAGLTNDPTTLAVAFIPLTAVTILIAILLEYTLQEGGIFSRAESGAWQLALAGWSRPLYLVGFLGMIYWQFFTLTSAHSSLVTSAHALLLALVGSVWLFSPFVLAALVLGSVSLLQQLLNNAVPLATWPIYIAVLGVIYGTLGYSLQFGQTQLGWRALKRFSTLWQRPLQIGSWFISITAVVGTISTLLTLFPFIVDVILTGQTFLTASAEAVVTTAVVTYGLTGLLFLATALAEKRPRLSYGALLLLLLSWASYMLMLNQQNNLQLYALPTSLYLLAIGWLEWRYGNQRLAIWVDYVGFLLLLGSVFYQSFGDGGRLYALLMVGEGLLLVWAGSWRRLRRYLYAGITAVVLGVGSQMINPILDLNAFVLLALGLLLVIIGIGLERRLEAVRALAKKFRLNLEQWD
jgi:hypothetical protein